MLPELNGDFLQWLRGFYHVARTGSVRKAAIVMRRNPSTISYQLRSLEEELNVILFDRFKRTLRITGEGKKLLAWTLSIFENIQGMRSEVCNADGTMKGEIRMAGTLPIINLAVPAIVKFIHANPLAKLKIERGLARDTRRLVEESEVDFGLLPILSRPRGEKIDAMFKARPLLIFARDNPWRIPAVPSLDDLKRLPYAIFMDSDGLDDLSAYAKDAGIGDNMEKNAIISANNYHIIMRFVWHGLGVTIMDELCFQATRFGAEWDKLCTVALDHILPNRVYGILTRHHKRLSPQALEFTKVLRTHFLNLPSLEASEAWLDLRQTGEKMEAG